MIDWNLVINIAVPILTLIIGAFLDNALAKKPKLISYHGHVSVFNVNTGEKIFPVHAHSIVLKNIGKATATNVTIGHNILPPNIHIYPNIRFTVEGTEIIIPSMVPNEQVTINYLYYPPITYAEINNYIKHDGGYAKQIYAFPTPLPSKWLTALVMLLMFIGIISTLYVLIKIIINHLLTRLA